MPNTTPREPRPIPPRPFRRARRGSRRPVLLGLTLLLAACALEPETRPRNVLMVVVDTLRQDHLACYGYGRDTAPTICRLATEGAAFDGISPTSWTKPATASLLTGLHPLRHQAIERNDRLPAAVPTLAEALADRGFTTLGISANGWISPHFGFDQGFAELRLLRGRKGGAAEAVEVNEALLPLLDTLDEPWFVYLHYVDPHEPYDPPAGWDGAPLPEPLAAMAPVAKESLDMANFVARDPRLLAAARDLYDGEIREVDSRLAEVLGWLEERQLDENLLTVVVSDHGEEFEEHGRVGHGMSLHREVIRVPVVFHAPGAVPAGSGEGRANLLDVTPTILDVLGVRAPTGDDRLDGVSLLPSILAEGQGRRARGGSPTGSDRGHLLHLELDDRPSLALLRADEKLMLARAPYQKALFDQAVDPGEEVDLLTTPAGRERFAGANRELVDAFNRLRRQANERDATVTAGRAEEVIRALGYLTPNEATVRPRLLPHRIVPVEPEPGGLLGWERTGELSSCVLVDDPAAEHQLLRGWRFIEERLGGRWTLPEATLVLAMPAETDGLRLIVRGANHRPDPVELTMRIDGEEVARGVFVPGYVEVELPLTPRFKEGPRMLVGIDSDPPYVPGPPTIGEAYWELGVFVSSVCLTAV